MKIGISACLGFTNCRYDGNCLNNFDLNKAKAFLKSKLNTDFIEFIPVCPEQLGGLPTPRPPAEIINGNGFDVLNNKAKVIDKNGRDVTEHFLKGASNLLLLAKNSDIQAFVLKERSPSCGLNQIYSGNFDGIIKSGSGLTSALLMNNNIMIFSDEETQS